MALLPSRLINLLTAQGASLSEKFSTGPAVAVSEAGDAAGDAPGDRRERAAGSDIDSDFG